MSTSKVRARITSEEGDESACELRFRSRFHTVLQAAGVCLGLWVFAAITVFVPVAHFVTVPLGIIGGPVAAWMIYHRRAGMFEIMDNSAHCPRCQGGLNFFWPQTQITFHGKCSHCYRGFDGSLIRDVSSER